MTSSGPVVHGRAFSGSSSAVRPSFQRDSGWMSGWAVRVTTRATAIPVPWTIRSGGTLSPEGAMATTEWARPRRASSSASRAPRELPRTCTRSRPASSRNRSSASVSARTVGRSRRCGERPTPGRSTLSTSKRSDRAGTTAVKSRCELPQPWRRSSGSPEPDRDAHRGAVMAEGVPDPARRTGDVRHARQAGVNRSSSAPATSMECRSVVPDAKRSSSVSSPMPGTTRGVVRVLVLADAPVLRRGLVGMVDETAGIQSVGAPGELRRGLTLAESARPDAVVVELGSGRGTTLATCRDLRRRFPQLAIVAVATSEDPAVVNEALAAGVRGYLLMNTSPTLLGWAILAARAGRTVVDPQIRRGETGGVPESRELVLEVPLTRRESDVLDELVKGQSNRSIGENLFISEDTVKSHVKAILRKLGARDRSHAVSDRKSTRLNSSHANISYAVF